MRNFIVTIEGKKYEVTVEEVSGFAAPAYTPAQSVAAAPAAPAPVPVPAAPAPAAPASKPATAPSAPAVTSGVEVESPMPGLILELKVAEGATVKTGDVIMVLEAMKMANDITAPADGVVSFRVAKGSNVDSGNVLAVIG